MTTWRNWPKLCRSGIRSLCHLCSPHSTINVPSFHTKLHFLLKLFSGELSPNCLSPNLECRQMQMRIFFSTGSHVALRLKLQRHCNETKMHREVLHCTGRLYHTNLPYTGWVIPHQITAHRVHWVGYITLTNPTLGALGGLHHTSLHVCIHQAQWLGYITPPFPTHPYPTPGALVGLYHVCIHWVHWLGGWDSVTRRPTLTVALLSLVLPSSPFSLFLHIL